MQATVREMRKLSKHRPPSSAALSRARRASALTALVAPYSHSHTSDLKYHYLTSFFISISPHTSTACQPGQLPLSLHKRPFHLSLSLSAPHCSIGLAIVNKAALVASSFTSAVVLAVSEGDNETPVRPLSRVSVNEAALRCERCRSSLCTLMMLQGHFLQTCPPLLEKSGLKTGKRNSCI